MRIAFYIFSLFLITACAATDNSEVIMTAKAFKAKKTEDVVVLYNEYPSCGDRQQIASISSGAMPTEKEAVAFARAEAASLGADYLTVDRVHVDTYTQSSVYATAYKCGSVNRYRVPLNKE